MLKQEDKQKLDYLISQNPEYGELVQKLKEDCQYTISKISHEIRNPLTIINSSLQLVQHAHPEVKQYKHWTDILKDIDYLILLLNDLSTFNNGEHLRNEIINPEKLFHDVMSNRGWENIKPRSVWKMECSDHVPHLYGDGIKIRQILTNLLKNAVEAISDNGNITVRLIQSGNNVLFEVEDDGCGIEPKDAETLFDPFVTHKENGSGLGLSISKRIAEAHNGSLSFTSGENGNTIFTLSLPIKKDVL